MKLIFIKAVWSPCLCWLLCSNKAVVPDGLFFFFFPSRSWQNNTDPESHWSFKVLWCACRWVLYRRSQTGRKKNRVWCCHVVWHPRTFIQNWVLQLHFRSFFFFFLTMQGLNSPTKRSNLCPLHWKGRILTAGPPGTSLCGVLFSWGPGLSQVVPSVLKNLEPLWLSWHQRKQRLKSSYETQGWKYHISVQTYSTE